jgi:DNA-binding CsgD family transcriptional regulator
MKTIYQSKKYILLTTREIEILNLIVQEQSTKEIAESLFLSTETVKSHRKKIMNKLDVKNVAGIVREAFLCGFFTVEKNTIKINDRLTIAS